MAKKIKVFVDAEVLVTAHFSGIGHYTLELLQALDRKLDTDQSVVVYMGVFYRHVGKLHRYHFRNFRFKRTPFPLHISNALKIKGLQFPLDLLYGKKLYIFPNYTSWPLLRSKSIPFIYDLSFEFFPQYVEPNNQRFLSKQVVKSAARASKVLTISTNSKKEIVEFYGMPESKVEIVYPGIDQSEFFRWPKTEVNKVKARYGIHGDYILFIGNIEPRKNLKNLLLAYEMLDKPLRDKYSLLLVGARGWLDNEIFDIIERLRISGNVIQQPLDYVKDEDRAAIISGAVLFVYPSLYEGFGIPPVEAMACGVPVISSDNSSLPEAVGDAAIKVNAESVEQLSESMDRVLKDKNLQKKMKDEGYAQADKFSWDGEAEKLLKMIKELGS